MTTGGTVLDEAVTRREELRSSRKAQYERLVEIRLLEDRVLDLFGEGLVPGTSHTCQGQEAVAVGVARAVGPDDFVACTYRGHGMALALGATREAVLGEIMGRQIGCIGGVGGSMHLSEVSVGLLPTFAIVGAGIPVATGAALAAQVLETGQVAVAVFGDGSTNIGAFHEGLNLAAIWKLPVVFLCENNLYGEYSRINKTTPITDLTMRAASYGMPSASVDGQDVDAVAAALAEAVRNAREGGGPTLIEARTYRFVGHSRSDPATYRPPGELDAWKQRDPIDLFGRKLEAEGVLAPEDREAILDEQRLLLNASVENVLASPIPTSMHLFSSVLARSSG
jgi:acetoin:2,6-dichlorophenolindophenol oxidoreductase subunit alpha